MNTALRGLLTPFSVEITPRETTKLPPLSDLLDPGTAVYLTFLPNVPWEQTVAAVRWVLTPGCARCRTSRRAGCPTARPCVTC